MTVFDAEPSNKCAEALENENCAVKFKFWFPETVKQLLPQKLLPKNVN
jgi:hypothetical protein